MAKRKKIPKAIRDKLLVDAMHRCCLCPEHHDVTDLHHIVPISEDGPNIENNLMVICPTCHAKIHRFRRSYTVDQLRMYKERWVRLCALALPLDVRIAHAFDYTRPPTLHQIPSSVPTFSLPDITSSQPAQNGLMPITPEIEQWLQDAGYEYHCFISWPRIRNRDMVECARRIKEAIEQDLALSIADPKVFLDETDLEGGVKWQETIAQALCRSIAMVAICAPIYYHPSHKWCGLEWAAMDILSESRLPGEDFKAIIPVILRQREPLPSPMAEIQFIDLSRVTICGRRYYSTQEFRQRIIEIAERIEKVAFVVARNGALADCKQFQLPTESAFSGYVGQGQPFPFRS